MKLMRRIALTLSAALCCVLLPACRSVPHEDPLSYQVYPITMNVRVVTPQRSYDADVTVEEAGSGTISFSPDREEGRFQLRLKEGTVTFCCGDLAFEIAPDPLLLPPLCEIVSLFGLTADDPGIVGERRVLPNGTAMTVHDGVPSLIRGAGYEIRIESFHAGDPAQKE